MGHITTLAQRITDRLTKKALHPAWTDAAIGAGVGAGIGGLSAIPGMMRGKSQKTEDRPNMLRRMLIGGAIGGAGLPALNYASTRGSTPYRSIPQRIDSFRAGQTKSGAAGEQQQPKGEDYPAHMFGHQSYLPTRSRRDLLPEEQSDIARSKKKLIPRLWTNWGTPMHETMASPKKQAILMALLGGLGGGTAGHFLNSAVGGNAPNMAPLVGAAAGASLLGIPTYFDRRSRNEGTEEMMRRLPPHPTLRDLASDPVQQEETNRSLYSAHPGSTFPFLMGYTLGQR